MAALKMAAGALLWLLVNALVPSGVSDLTVVLAGVGSAVAIAWLVSKTIRPK